LINEDISATALRARSAAFLASARAVIAPSEDVAARMRRHFPTLRPTIRPHGDDRLITPPAPPGPRDGRCRVCVLGAIGVHKGYDVLLNCARDAARRDLKLDFILVGKSIDDARLLATGRVFITGGYRQEEAVALVRRQNASLALLPSIWPETWSLGLTELWQAGLSVAAFDLGTPAERIRRTGYGFLLPPNLPPQGINNALVASVGLSRHERK
jgi:glycosyltransferase involved in cell wall biosynthesis